LQVELLFRLIVRTLSYQRKNRAEAWHQCPRPWHQMQEIVKGHKDLSTQLDEA
jgi:hypothetical protein